ncbi:unnamed protein product [Aphanomyces euteiches]
MFENIKIPGRDVDSLRRKFAQLKNHPKPTGSPSCPDDVRRAKQISREIDNSVGVLAMEDDNDLGEDNESESDGNAVTQETIVEQEKPNRTGLDRNALAELSNELKRKRATESTGGTTDEKATSDWMTMMMMLDTRTAEREVLREQREREWRTQENMRQEKALEVQRAREDRREEMHMLLLSKLIEKK